MRKIALEEHFGTPELMQLRLDWFKRDGMPLTLPMEEVQRVVRLICDVDKRLEEMDRLDIERQLLLPGSNGIEGIRDGNEALEACKRYNDVVAETVAKYPDRFMACAAIPFQAPELAVKEIERCAKAYNARSSWLPGYVNNCGFIDEEKFYPVWEAAEKYGFRFYLHPTETPKHAFPPYAGYPALIGPPWSWGVDTATYMLRIILSGLFDKYPNTIIILGHMGEMLPFILWRLENRLGVMPSEKKLNKSIRQYFRDNVYVTISGNLANAALRCAIDAFGADRVMFATDYPFEPLQPTCEFIETANVTEEERKLICYDNAAKLFGIK